MKAKTRSSPLSPVVITKVIAVVEFITPFMISAVAVALPGEWPISGKPF